MFLYDKIQKYNETDIRIYKYIVSNLDKIQYMTIRELAGETYTSPAAVLRFCGKNGCQGYTELKEALKREAQILRETQPSADLKELSSFFERADSNAFEEKLLSAADMIRRAELVIFLGMGSSGTLAGYGARYFSNIGKFSVGLEDTYYPAAAYSYKNAVVIALSESGETAEVVELAKQFRQKNCPVLSITNSSRSTLARISDWNFSYHFSRQRVNGDYNATTQVPVVFVIESLARRI